MSVIYTQSTVTSVGVGPTGHVHNKANPGDGKPFALECGACEPFLVKEGWVYSSELVPLTESETREKERIEREGNLAVKRASEQMAAFAMAATRGSPAPAKRTISDAQKAKMAAGRAAKKAATPVKG